MNNDCRFSLTLEQGWSDLQAFAAGDTIAPVRLHASLHDPHSRTYQANSDNEFVYAQGHDHGGQRPSVSSPSSRILAVEALAPQLLLRVCTLQWPSGSLVPTETAHPMNSSNGADKVNTASLGTQCGNTAPVVPSAAIILVAMLNAAYVSQILAPTVLRQPVHLRPLQLEELLLLYADVLCRTTSLGLFTPAYFSKEASPPTIPSAIALPEIAERQLLLCCSVLLLLLREANELMSSMQSIIPTSRVGTVAHVLLTLQLWGMTMDVLKDSKRLDIGGIRRTQLRRVLHQRVDLLLEYTEEALRYYLSLSSRSGMQSEACSRAGSRSFSFHVFLRAPPLQVLLHAMQFMNHGVVFPLEGNRLQNNCISSLSNIELAAAAPQHPLLQFLERLPHRLVWQWATHCVGSGVTAPEQYPNSSGGGGTGNRNTTKDGDATEVSCALALVCAALRLCSSVEESTAELLYSSLTLSIHLQSPYRQQMDSCPSGQRMTLSSTSIRGIIDSCTIVGAIMESAGKSLLLLDSMDPHRIEEAAENDTKWVEARENRREGGMESPSVGSSAASHHSSSSAVLQALLPLFSDASQTLLFVLQRGGGRPLSEEERQKQHCEVEVEEENEEEVEAVRAACEGINSLVEELLPDPIPSFEPTDDVEDYEETVSMMREVNAEKEVVRKKLQSFFVACQEAIARRLERCLAPAVTGMRVTMEPQQSEGEGGRGDWDAKRNSGAVYFSEDSQKRMERECERRREKHEELKEALDTIANTILSGEDFHQLSFHNPIVALWITYERLYEILQQLPHYLTEQLTPTLPPSLPPEILPSELPGMQRDCVKGNAVLGLLPCLPSCDALLQYVMSYLPLLLQQQTVAAQQGRREEGLACPPFTARDPVTHATGYHSGLLPSYPHFSSSFPSSTLFPHSSPSYNRFVDSNRTTSAESESTSRSCFLFPTLLTEAILFPAVVLRLWKKSMPESDDKSGGTKACFSDFLFAPTNPYAPVQSQYHHDGMAHASPTPMDEERIVQCMTLLLQVFLPSMEKASGFVRNALLVNESRGCGGTTEIWRGEAYSYWQQHWRLASSVARSLALLCKGSMAWRMQRKGEIVPPLTTITPPSLLCWKEAAEGLALWLACPSIPLPFLWRKGAATHFSSPTCTTAADFSSLLYCYHLDLSHTLSRIGELLGDACGPHGSMFFTHLLTTATTGDRHDGSAMSSYAVLLSMQLFSGVPPLDGEESVQSFLNLVENGVMEAAQWEKKCSDVSIPSSFIVLHAAGCFEERIRDGKDMLAAACHSADVAISTALPALTLFTSSSSCHFPLSFFRFQSWMNECVAPRVRDHLVGYFRSLPDGATALAALLKQWWYHALRDVHFSSPPHASLPMPVPLPDRHGGASFLSCAPPYGENGEESGDGMKTASSRWRLVSGLLRPLSLSLPPSLRLPLVIEVCGAFISSLQQTMQRAEGWRAGHSFAVSGGVMHERNLDEEERAIDEEEEQLVKEMSMLLPRLLSVEVLEAIGGDAQAGEGCVEVGYFPSCFSSSPYACCSIVLPLLHVLAVFSRAFLSFCFTSRASSTFTSSSGVCANASVPPLPSAMNADTRWSSPLRSEGGGRRSWASIIGPPHFTIFLTLLHVSTFLFDKLSEDSFRGIGSISPLREEGREATYTPGGSRNLPYSAKTTQRAFLPQEVEERQLLYWKGASAMLEEGTGWLTERVLGENSGPSFSSRTYNPCEGVPSTTAAFAYSSFPEEWGEGLPLSPLSLLLLQCIECFFCILFTALQCWILTKGGCTVLSLCNESSVGNETSLGELSEGSSSREGEDDEGEENSAPFSSISSSPCSLFTLSIATSEACDTMKNHFRKDLATLANIARLVFEENRAQHTCNRHHYSSNEDRGRSTSNAAAALSAPLLGKLRQRLEDDVMTPGYAHLDSIFPEGRGVVNNVLNSLVGAVDMYERQSLLSRLA